MRRLSELVELWDDPTFANHFMMNGGNILTLQMVLGHSDIKMTMRYSHLSPDYLEEATKLNPLSFKNGV
jgi:site-specific recombinase XerD